MAAVWRPAAWPRTGRAAPRPASSQPGPVRPHRAAPRPWPRACAMSWAPARPVYLLQGPIYTFGPPAKAYLPCQRMGDTPLLASRKHIRPCCTHSCRAASSSSGSSRAVRCGRRIREAEIGHNGFHYRCARCQALHSGRKPITLFRRWSPPRRRSADRHGPALPRPGRIGSASLPLVDQRYQLAGNR